MGDDWGLLAIPVFFLAAGLFGPVVLVLFPVFMLLGYNVAIWSGVWSPDRPGEDEQEMTGAWLVVSQSTQERDYWIARREELGAVDEVEEDENEGSELFG